jgi:cell division septation protein DedD
MARFGFRKRASEEDEVPLEGDLDVTPSEELPEVPEGGDEGGGRSRRILIIVGLGIILLGGFYIANQLFLTPPPPPPPPVRQAMPTPPAKAPAPASAPVPAAPAKEATSAPSAQAKAPTAPATPPAKVEAKPTPPAPPASGPAKTGESKAAEAMKAPAPAKATAKPVPAAQGGYSLQVAAMVVEENAQGLKQKLDQGGFQSVIRKATAFVTKHVVTAGEPTGKSEAEELARRLTVDGFPSQLLVIGDKYSPQIGAFFNLDEAIDLARELQKKNYRPKITSKPANTLVFQVRHGKFDSRSAAVKRGGELKAKGFNFLVVRD